MPNDGTGQNWDNTRPALSDPVKVGWREILDLRKGTHLRTGREHEEFAGSGAGGEHKTGSAKIYRQADEPATRPDGATPLDEDDAGRLWLKTGETPELFVWDGSEWVELEIAEANLADGAITTVKLADGAAATAKLADGAVTAGKLADGAVETGKIAAGAVTDAKLASGAVTTARLADKSVTQAKVGAVLGDYATRNEGTTYQAATDGFLIGGGGSHANLDGTVKIGASSPPTVPVWWCKSGDAHWSFSFMAIVPRGWYYKVDMDHGSGWDGKYKWFPLGAP